MGLSSRTSLTSTLPVIESPGRTGALKRQWTSRRRTRARQVLGDHGVQDGAGHATLHDDLAESARPRGRVVVVQRVPVAADLGEQPDVPRATVRLRSALPTAGMRPPQTPFDSALIDSSVLSSGTVRRP